MKKSKLFMPIAGIAALGSTIAPIATLSSCGCTKLVSDDDVKFLDSANTYLAKKEGQISCHKAVQILKDLGIDVTNYKLSNGNSRFAFDASAKRFIIMNGDTVAAAPKDYTIKNTQSLFIFTTTYNKDSKYGQYLLDNFELPTNADELDVKTSLDVGNNQNITKIKYVADANNAKNILLRTNSQVVEIDAKKDTVFHMGVANNLTVVGNVARPNFYEVGWVGYLRTKNVKLNTIILDNATEKAQIDILDPSSTTGNSLAADTVSYRTADLEGTTDQPGTPVTPTPVTKESEFSGNTAGIYQLQNDIVISTTITITANIVLDLNGKTITSTVIAGQDAIKVKPATTDCRFVIIDSSTDQQGTVEFKENYISVAGDALNKLKAANPLTGALVIEGGNFNFTGTKGNRSGFIKVGETFTDAEIKAGIPKIAYSEFYMYGGKITTKLDTDVPSEHDNQANGVYVLANTYVQITSGTIESSEACIRGVGTYNGPDSYIDITGGNFKQTSKSYGECIFQPQGGTLQISGGNFEGRGCIATKNANVHITGGYFHATGEHMDLTSTDSKTQPHDCDGSVICMELTGTQYGVNPSITVNNATLYSEKSYILQIYGTARQAGEYHYAEADFFSGVYYYATDAGEGSVAGYSGVRIFEKGILDARVNQWGGSWVKSN